MVQKIFAAKSHSQRGLLYTEDNLQVVFARCVTRPCVPTVCYIANLFTTEAAD